MNTFNQKIALSPLLVGLALGGVFSTPVWAQVDIAPKPLFVTAGVESNIIVAIDDSGSMDSEVLMPTNDGALWFHRGDDSFVGRDASDNAAMGVLNYNQAGGANDTWQKTTYLFPNGSGAGARVYRDSNNDHFAVPPLPQYAFTRSADFNGMYYDYQLDYQPWPSVGANTFADAPPAAARSEPLSASPTFDLTREHQDTANNWKFRVYNGMVLPAGTTYYDGGQWITLTSDLTWSKGETSIGMAYWPASYYVLDTSAQTYTVSNGNGTVTGSCSSPQAQHYVYFEENPGSLIGVDALAYDGSCLTLVEIRQNVSFPSQRSYTDEMQNFANWWSYYRKRHLTTRSGLASTFENKAGLRMGALTINSRSLRGMYSLSDNADRDNFFDFVYSVDGNSAGTPNRETLDYIGDQFDGNTGIIQEACQQNFALLFTDGFANPNTSSGVGNADASMGVPHADNFSNTIADIAAHYYKKHLRQAQIGAGQVPVPQQCNQVNPPASLDCQVDPHMVTYGITLGAQGNIFGTTHFNVEDAHLNPPAWVAPTQTRNPVQVDDLYHAAVNGHGEMLNARSADELALKLDEAINSITDRSRRSGTSSSTSAAILRTDTLLYSVEFRSDDWSGNLIAQEVSVVDGSVLGVAWDADAILDNRLPDSRNMLTFNGSTGVPFNYNDLNSAQQNALDRSTSNAVDNRGAQRVDWLRGSDVAVFRDRDRMLGDIVNSTPVYVGTPNRGYGFLPAVFSPGTYGAFRTSIESRPAVLAVGANDGFLHVFNADTGDELFAYMPGELLDTDGSNSFAQVSVLADKNYDHRFFVDGTPAVNDVLIGGNWRTVLVGSMGVGGRSIFAIDITDPTNVSGSNVLWEFSHPDLGHGVTEVQIVPMADGRFAAVFGNGYNGDSDTAVLFVVDIATGALIRKLDTGAGDSVNPNGLGPVVASSWPQLNFTTQYAYAGDLQGNLWRFNLTDVNSPANWSVDLKLFTATDQNGVSQPITVQPRLSLNPKRPGELIINFGTGAYFRDQDNFLVNPQVQTLYGIREDLGSTTFTRGDLLQQEIIWQDQVIALGEPRIVRAMSDNVYNGNNEENGWYLDLAYQGNNIGERVVSKVTFPSGNRRERVRFTTMTPSDDVCAAGRTGFIFDLDLFTGGATDRSVFDINDDGFFNVQDLVGNRMINAISGGKGEELTVIRNQDGSGDFFYDGIGGRIGNTTGAEGRASGDPLGRQSWQQLR